MQNIMIGIKRFLKNKNTVTIFAILLSMGILYWAWYDRIKKATEPVNVPYAVSTIDPRQPITEDMISIRKVPGGVVKNSDVLMDTDSIVGKYVANYAVIPENGLFYADMVVAWEDMPSSNYEDIPDGYTVYPLSVGLESTFGNSIYPGNYIDIYYEGVDEDDKRIYSKFIESIRVLAVVDSDGHNVFEKADEPEKPSYLLFSVPDDIYELLLKAGDGNLVPVQRNLNYSLNPKQMSIVSDNIYIKELIESKYISNEIINQGKKNSAKGGN